jgi:activator of 2-hydroxyglutaryl-CoA dehydratase
LKNKRTLTKVIKLYYPTVARCRVFAKTETSLLNEGAPKEDIATSILQAVVKQIIWRISKVAVLLNIKGKVCFLGRHFFFYLNLENVLYRL